MVTERMLRLGAFFSGTGSNMASWRHPNAVPDGPINLEYYKTLTRKAESAKLDFVFFGDGLYISEKSHPIFLNRYPLALASLFRASAYRFCGMGRPRLPWRVSDSYSVRNRPRSFRMGRTWSMKSLNPSGSTALFIMNPSAAPASNQACIVSAM